VSYEIDISTIKNVVNVIGQTYRIDLVKISQILCFAEAKCDELSIYGETNQLNQSAALEEESKTQSILIEQQINKNRSSYFSKDEYEAKGHNDSDFKVEEEKSNIQGARKNTYEEEEETKFDDLEVKSQEKPEHQHFLESEHPYLIKINRIATMEMDSTSDHQVNSLGLYESMLSERLVPAEQSQRVASFN